MILFSGNSLANSCWEDSIGPFPEEAREDETEQL